MKKIIIVCLLIIFILTGIIFYLFNKPNVDLFPVKDNGKLRIENTNIINEHGEKFRLKGISSSGIQWTYDILTYENLEKLKKEFNINAFRLAMYTEENGYISNPDKIFKQVSDITDILIELDLYIVIDWHILNDGNPSTYIEQSKIFFDKYSQKYKDYPNILYEICNEPNGTEVTWNDSIKPYANTIIPIIRNNAPDSIIIVGAPHWCTKFADLSENPLDYQNILYSCHHYAGTYANDIKENIRVMKERNLPVIVTECGLTDKTGDGDLYYNEFTEWLEYLDTNEISWFYWSFSNTPPTSSILKQNYKPNKNINNYLTDSGKRLKDYMKKTE